MNEKNKFLLFVVLIVLIGAVAVNVFNAPIFPTTVDDPTYHTGIPLSAVNSCNTVHNKVDVWDGCSAQDGTIGYGRTELLDDIKYVTSFSGSNGANSYSEKIAISGNIHQDSSVIADGVANYYYKVYIKEGGNDWKQIVGLNVVDPSVKLTGQVGRTDIRHKFGFRPEVLLCPGPVIQLIGSHVGALKVELVVHFLTYYGFTNIISDEWDQTMATDYAYLISGNGKINIAGYQSWEVPMFENGENVPIQVSCDYSGPTVDKTGRWELWAFPQDGRSGQMITTFSDYTRTTYNWKLPDDAWRRGTNNSQWRIELFNTLFSQDAIVIETIDIRANAPPTPTLTVSSDEISLGGSITASFSGNVNNLTNESISFFRVRCVYRSNDYQFLYTTVSSSVGTITFTPPVADPEGFELQVWSHDVAGRESEKPAQVQIIVYSGHTPLPVILGGGIDLWILAIVIIIAVAGVAIYLYQRRGGKLHLPKFGRKKK